MAQEDSKCLAEMYQVPNLVYSVGWIHF